MYPCVSWVSNWWQRGYKTILLFLFFFNNWWNVFAKEKKMIFFLLHILLRKKRLLVDLVDPYITPTFDSLSYLLFVFASSLILLFQFPLPFPSKIVNSQSLKKTLSLLGPFNFSVMLSFAAVVCLLYPASCLTSLMAS